MYPEITDVNRKARVVNVKCPVCGWSFTIRQHVGDRSFPLWVRWNAHVAQCHSEVK